MEKSINGFYCFRLTENKENALLLRDKGGAFLFYAVWKEAYPQEMVLFRFFLP